MATIAQLPINSTVSFDVYAASLLGTQYQNVKVMAHLDMDTARFWIDPEAMHVNMYPFIKNMGVPDDPSEYSYVKVRLTNGEFTVLALPWIRSDTVEVYSESTLVLTLENVSSDDRENIVRALAANGYKPSKVELK